MLLLVPVGWSVAGFATHPPMIRAVVSAGADSGEPAVWIRLVGLLSPVCR
jgi:hypothetical protein